MIFQYILFWSSVMVTCIFHFPLSSWFYRELRSSQTLAFLLCYSSFPGHFGFGVSVALHAITKIYSKAHGLVKVLIFFFWCIPINITTFFCLLCWGIVPWCSSVGIFSVVTLKNHKMLGTHDNWNIFWHASKQPFKKVNPLNRILTPSKRDLYYISSSFLLIVFMVFFRFGILL